MILFFPGAYGGLAKIDHAILTAGGILCIQTKHYNGVVFGGEDEAQWTNVDGIQRRRFLNPLIQNEGRTRALQKVIPGVPVANLVIFTGKVEFTTPPPKNVIHVDNLESYVAKFVFGPSKVDDWHAVWVNRQRGRHGRPGHTQGSASPGWLRLAHLRPHRCSILSPQAIRLRLREWKHPWFLSRPRLA